MSARIGTTVADSSPWWPTPPKPADSAPNILVVLFDDVGFSDFGCYGSPIETPTIDRLAAEGLRFTGFHMQEELWPAADDSNLLRLRTGDGISCGSHLSCEVGVCDYARRGVVAPGRHRSAHLSSRAPIAQSVTRPNNLTQEPERW
jgi:hypothetical protein